MQQPQWIGIPAVDATWIEAALMVIYYFCFDEQSPASFPELSLKGNISQSVEQDLECLFQRRRTRKKATQIYLKHKLNLHDHPVSILDALQTKRCRHNPIPMSLGIKFLKNENIFSFKCPSCFVFAAWEAWYRPEKL